MFNGWSLLTDQGDIWRSIHPTLVWVYYICVVAALWGTVQSYPEIYARVTHDFRRRDLARAAILAPALSPALSPRTCCLSPRRWCGSERQLRHIDGNRRLPRHGCRRRAGDDRRAVPRPPTPAALSHALVVLRRLHSLRRHPHCRQLHQRLGPVAAGEPPLKKLANRTRGKYHCTSICSGLAIWSVAMEFSTSMSAAVRFGN